MRLRAHPQYGLYAPVWEKLANCYSGDGGFLDGTYLVAHPREWEDYTATNPKKPTKKLKARRAIARYENVAGTILNQLQAALFRESITRTIGKDEDSTEKHPLSAWWRNVDGKGTCSIDDYMATHWIHCGLYGHIVHLMDLPRATEAPLTQADAGEPFLCAYTPTDVADWRIDDYGAVTAVKLLEVETQPDIKVGATEDASACATSRRIAGIWSPTMGQRATAVSTASAGCRWSFSTRSGARSRRCSASRS
jgi:hypothetical protein